MEKIIEYPKINCPCCHCIFTFTKEDIKTTDDFKTINEHRQTVYERKYYVICPICDKKYIINTKPFTKK